MSNPPRHTERMKNTNSPCRMGTVRMIGRAPAARRCRATQREVSRPSSPSFFRALTEIVPSLPKILVAAKEKFNRQLTKTRSALISSH
jgi:hypothetical protein